MSWLLQISLSVELQGLTGNLEILQLCEILDDEIIDTFVRSVWCCSALHKRPQVLANTWICCHLVLWF